MHVHVQTGACGLCDAVLKETAPEDFRVIRTIALGVKTKSTLPDASPGPCEFSLRRHRRCIYPFLQTLLGSGQNGHEALQGRDEVLLDGLRLRSGRVPPAVVHVPQRWDEDFRQQLLHTF